MFFPIEYWLVIAVNGVKDPAECVPLFYKVSVNICRYLWQDRVTINAYINKCSKPHCS